MKKMLLIKTLCLFLLGITTATAQNTEQTKFEVTTIEGNQFKDAKWYLVNMNETHAGLGHAKGYMKANNTDTDIDFFFDANQVDATDDQQLWCFVAEGNGYRIYNKAKGATKSITYSTTGLATFNTPTDNTSTWILTETSNTGYKSRGGFCFKNEQSNQYLNKQDSKMKFWKNPDEGSTFFVEKVDGAKLDQTITKAEMYQVGTGVGKYSDNSNTFANALKAAKDAQKDTQKSAGEKYNLAKNLEKAIKGLTLNMPEAGKFYTFQGNSNSYISATAVGPNSRPVMTENADEAVFYVNASMKLVTANALCLDAAVVVDNLGTATTFQASEAEGKVGKYVIRNNGKSFSDTNLDTHKQLNWRSKENEGKTYADCAWTIVEVKEQSKWSKLTKKMSADYATLAAPVALTIPEGVQAFTVTSEGNNAVLAEVQNTIPAGTAVLLKKTNEAASFDFNFAAGEATAESTTSNQLTGVYKAKEIPEGSYILANGSKGIGFYKVKADDRNLAANKAYLTVPAAQAHLQSIIIGGNTTGIDEIVTGEAAKEVYFDLQGRRVQNPTKGIYVTKSGKKVIFN